MLKFLNDALKYQLIAYQSEQIEKFVGPKCPINLLISLPLGNDVVSHTLLLHC